MTVTRDPVEVLQATRRALGGLSPLVTAMLEPLEAGGWRRRPAPTEWSPVEIVCHLRDEEQDDFGARLEAVLTGRPRVDRIDPEAWVEERRYREVPPAEALAALRARRERTLARLAEVAPARLQGTLELEGGFRLSGLDLLVAWVTHDRLHLAQLAGTLARLWADQWAPLRAGYAGPIPYPPGS